MALDGARRREQLLVRIEAALKRIDTETFGDCFVCGEEIDARRLRKAIRRISPWQRRQQGGWVS